MADTISVYGKRIVVYPYKAEYKNDKHLPIVGLLVHPTAKERDNFKTPDPQADVLLDEAGVDNLIEQLKNAKATAKAMK